MQFHFSKKHKKRPTATRKQTADSRLQTQQTCRNLFELRAQMQATKGEADKQSEARQNDVSNKRLITVIM